MARSRNIKPGFFANESLAEVDPLGRLLFAGIWTIADRAGRLEDRPKRIKAQVLPYDECDAEKLVQELHNRGFILRYDHGGNQYIQVLAWDKHQNPHVNERASTIQAPCKHSASTPELGTTRADSLIPSSLIPREPSPSLRSGAGKRSGNGHDLTPTNPTVSQVSPAGPAWESYEFAYLARYRAAPKRNARVNGQMAKFVKLVGAAEAPGIVEFYLRHNDARYVREAHSVGMLVAHAEKLHTEWVTGNRVTVTAAQQGDKLQATGDTFRKLIQEAHEPQNP